MRKILILSLIIILSACGGDYDSEAVKTTYLSCKINSSHAITNTERDNDLLQCWNADGSGYESQVYAVQWCEQQVNAYISSEYLVGHTVTYSVESTSCTE